MHAQLRAADHQRIAHIVAGVPHIHQAYILQMSEMLPDGQHIRQDLVGWYSLVSPFHTGTPAYLARSSTISWPNPRYSIPSNMRPSTRLCPGCSPSFRSGSLRDPGRWFPYPDHGPPPQRHSGFWYWFFQKSARYFFPAGYPPARPFSFYPSALPPDPADR